MTCQSHITTDLQVQSAYTRKTMMRGMGFCFPMSAEACKLVEWHCELQFKSIFISPPVEILNLLFTCYFNIFFKISPPVFQKCYTNNCFITFYGCIKCLCGWKLTESLNTKIRITHNKYFQHQKWIPTKAHTWTRAW